MRLSLADYEKLLARNPGLRRLETYQPKPPAPAPLAGSQPAQSGGKGGLVVVTFTVFVKREFDGDNLQGSLKPLRDAIAASLGMDDGGKRIRWEYGQQETRGRVGVVVKINIIEK